MLLCQCAIRSNDFAKMELSVFVFDKIKPNAMNRKAYFGLLKTAWNRVNGVSYDGSWQKLLGKNALNGQDQTDNSCTMIRHKCSYLNDRDFPKMHAVRMNKRSEKRNKHTNLPIILSWILLCLSEEGKKMWTGTENETQTNSDHKNCIPATVSYLPWTRRSRWWTNVTSHISQECNEANEAYTHSRFLAWRMTFTRHKLKMNAY